MADSERKAGYGLVIALSITALVGTGMFFGPSLAARYAGNASLLAWIALAVIGAYVGACFAELSSIFPEAGGLYQFAKRAYGRFVSFIVGWIAWLVASVTSSLMIVAAFNYLLPNQDPLFRMVAAICMLLLLTAIALGGIEASTAVLLFFAAISLSVLVSIITVGALHIDPANYTPLFTPGQQPSTVLIALFFIVESFFGWEAMTYMSNETRNPEKIIPNSILYTSIAVAALVILFPLVILGILPAQSIIAFDTPVTTIASLLFGQFAGDLFNIAIFLSLIGCAAGGIVATPRLIQALAKDKLFIEQLSSTHPRLHTPHKAILFQTVVSLVVIVTAFGDYESLLSMLVPLALIMYVFALLAVPILRRKYPREHRGVKVPLGLAGPVLLSLVYLGIVFAWLLLVPASFLLFKKIISFIVFGVPIYILLNLYYNPDVLQKTVNSFAPLNKLFERLLLPRAIRNDILNTFQDVEGKTVLEFGAGVGSLTMTLAERVGKEGRIYAVDLSKKNIEILTKRLRKKNHAHVTPIHDEHFISRVHPSVPQVDMVFSVGNLSYIQDLKRVLADMHRILPENGRICLVEYVDYFWGLIPDQAWLDDPEKLKALFREAGFSVRIRKRTGFFWRYLYVYGIKSDSDVPVI